MEWTANLNEKNLRISLPDQLIPGLEQEACINGEKIKFTWDERQKRLLIKDKQTGLYHGNKLRSHQISSYPGESKREIDLEVTGTKTYFISASLSELASAESARGKSSEKKGSKVRSPITGKVLQVLKSAGDKVQQGETLAIVEAMKMENKINAPKAGFLESISVENGQAIQVGSEIANIEATSPN